MRDGFHHGLDAMTIWVRFYKMIIHSKTFQNNLYRSPSNNSKHEIYVNIFKDEAMRRHAPHCQDPSRSVKIRPKRGSSALETATSVKSWGHRATGPQAGHASDDSMRCVSMVRTSDDFEVRKISKKDRKVIVTYCDIL